MAAQILFPPPKLSVNSSVPGPFGCFVFCTNQSHAALLLRLWGKERSVRVYASSQVSTLPLLFRYIFKGEKRIPLYASLLRAVLKVMTETCWEEAQENDLTVNCSGCAPSYHSVTLADLVGCQLRRFPRMPKEIWPWRPPLIDVGF